MITQIAIGVGIAWLVINFLVPDGASLGVDVSGLYQQYKLEFWIIAGVLFYVYVLPRLQKNNYRRRY